MAKPTSEWDIILGMDDIEGLANSIPVSTRILPSGEVEAIDQGLPWEEDPLYGYTPATGAADSLVKAAEDTALREELFGADVDFLLRTARPSATKALEKRIAEVAGRAATNYMQKAASVIKNAPLRKQAVSGIVDKFKRELINKGHREGVEHFGSDGWERLTASMESVVTSSLLAA